MKRQVRVLKKKKTTAVGIMAGAVEQLQQAIEHLKEDQLAASIRCVKATARFLERRQKFEKLAKLKKSKQKKV